MPFAVRLQIESDIRDARAIGLYGVAAELEAELRRAGR